jgi:hypothetical protein
VDVDSSCEASIIQAAFKSLGIFNWPIFQAKRVSLIIDHLFSRVLVNSHDLT